MYFVEMYRIFLFVSLPGCSSRKTTLKYANPELLSALFRLFILSKHPMVIGTLQLLFCCQPIESEQVPWYSPTPPPEWKQKEKTGLEAASTRPSRTRSIFLENWPFKLAIVRIGMIFPKHKVSKTKINHLRMDVTSWCCSKWMDISGEI